MKFERVLILTLFLLPATASIVAALSIGISPGVEDLGLINKGETFIIKYHIISVNENNIVLGMNSLSAGPDRFNPGKPRTIKFDVSQASEEKVGGWVSFLDNPIILPTQRTLFINNEGRSIEANQEVEAVLRVPQDAEPGQHIGLISLEPRNSFSGTSEKQIATIATIVYVYTFTVPGKVAREAKVIGFSSDYNTGKVSVIVKNTGTVSLNVWGLVEIYTGLPERYMMDLTHAFLKPGETTTLVARLNQPIEEGVYKAQAILKWHGGESQKEGFIDLFNTISAAPETQKEIPKEEHEGFNMIPIFIVFIVIIIVIVVWRLRR